jgi:hypothetical protein
MMKIALTAVLLVAFSAFAEGVVLLPLDNISGAPDAPAAVRAALTARVRSAGWTVIEGDVVEPVLERNRVRYMDSISEGVRGELAKATGAAAVMMVAIPTFRGGDQAVVTLSGRLVAADGTLLWSNIGGARDEQTERILGGTKRKGPLDLAADAVRDLTRDLPHPGRTAESSYANTIRRNGPVTFVDRELASRARPRVCVLPFDSSSERPEAALIVANALALRLARNFEVVEPADLRAAAVKARIGSFRALGTDELKKLAPLVGTPLFLRGTISKYADAGRGAVPELELELFLIDVDAGSVLWAATHARSGADYVGLLMLGGVSDGATLADRAACELAIAERKQAARKDR